MGPAAGSAGGLLRSAGVFVRAPTVESYDIFLAARASVGCCRLLQGLPRAQYGRRRDAVGRGRAIVAGCGNPDIINCHTH